MTTGATGQWMDCDELQTISYDPTRKAFMGSEH